RGDFTLAEGGAWAPAATVRRRTESLLLAEDRGALTFGAWEVPHGPAWDEHRRPCFWQGQAPTRLAIWNGTGRTRRAVFAAAGRAGPSNPDVSKRTVRWACAGRAGEAVLSHANDWQLRVPLTVPPGRHVLTLAVGEPATVRAHPADPRDLLLLVTELRLETPAPSRA